MPPNILQLQREVESLPDDRLIMEAQNPSMFPSYLVAQEIQRREQDRQAFAAQMAQQPQASVYEQKIQQFGQGMPDAFSGIGALGGVQTAARGGMIGYADGGEVGPDPDPRNGTLSGWGAEGSVAQKIADIAMRKAGLFGKGAGRKTMSGSWAIPENVFYGIEGSAPFSSQITAEDQVPVEGSRQIPRTDGPPLLPAPEAGTKKEASTEDILTAFGISNKPRDVVPERITAPTISSVPVGDYYAEAKRQAEALGGLTEEEQALQAYRESLANRIMGRIDPEMDRMDIQSYIFSRVGQQARGEEEGTMYGGVRSLMESQRERNELLEDRANAIREANLATTAATRRAAMEKVLEIDADIASNKTKIDADFAIAQSGLDIRALSENAERALKAAIANQQIDADYANRLLSSLSGAEKSGDSVELLKQLSNTLDVVLRVTTVTENPAKEAAMNEIIAMIRGIMSQISGADTAGQ
jgi:hypothetical protein